MSFRRIVSTVAEIGAVAAIAYTVVAIACTSRFARRDAAPGGQAPPVTLLVPLHGAEPHLEGNLRAFAAQDYPDYQLVMGVAREDDPALPVARRIAAEKPGRQIDITVGAVAGARNPKIANVLSMMRAARHRLLIMADSDTRVDPAYVGSITAPLHEDRTGAVTCLFAGVPDDTFPARIGAMFMNEQFIPSVLVNRLFGPMHHCLGPSNAVRAGVLEAIGGFEALAPHLADDFMLGHLVSERGMRVVISHYVVHTMVSDPTLRALFDHELRWHRTIRALRPAGYAGMILTYPLPLALGALAVSLHRRRAALVLAAAVVARIALQRVAARALGVRPAALWLVLPRDLFGLAVWARGLTGSGVRWRGAQLHVAEGDLLAERS